MAKLAIGHLCIYDSCRKQLQRMPPCHIKVEKLHNVFVNSARSTLIDVTQDVSPLKSASG